MTTPSANRLCVSFWTIAALALIWNGMGIMNMIMQMDPLKLAAYPASHRALIETQPAWAKGMVMLSVIGGALGGLLLLLRKRLAIYAFLISLLGAIAAMIHTLGSGIEFSVFEIALTVVLPVVLVVFWTWHSNLAARKGQIS